MLRLLPRYRRKRRKLAPSKSPEFSKTSATWIKCLVLPPRSHLRSRQRAINQRATNHSRWIGGQRDQQTNFVVRSRRIRAAGQSIHSAHTDAAPGGISSARLPGGFLRGCGRRRQVRRAADGGNPV